MRRTFGQVISNCRFSATGSICVFGGGGGGGGPSPPSCGRKVNGTPKMLTYSGSKSPGLRVHFVTSVRAQPSPDHLLAEQLAGERPQAP